MTTASILDQLKVLVDLQQIDLKIYQLQAQIDTEPEEVARIQGQKATLAEELKSTEEKYKTTEIRRKEMEIDLGGKEEKIKKLQGQLFQLKSNKEYSAMQKEIEGLKADNSVLEEEILKFMEQSDEIKKQVETERQGQKSRESSFDQELAQLEQEKQTSLQEIEKFNQGRSQITSRVEPKILSRYERILERKEGQAMAPVRNGSCNGCNMVLPPQQINEIQLGVTLITCDQCARILYIEPSINK